MSVKATNQITIVDITDAYSVMLTSEAYTFVGNITGAIVGSKCTTQAVAYCGTNQCTNVTINSNSISSPSGLTAEVSGNGTASPTITFTVASQITDACEATIPVVVDGVTVNKKFSFAVAKTGATGQTGQTGQTGKKGDDGVDAVTIVITSSAGTVFKNSSGTTTLTARVFRGETEISLISDGTIQDPTNAPDWTEDIKRIRWYRVVNGESTLIGESKEIEVSAADISGTCTYEATLE